MLIYFKNKYITWITTKNINSIENMKLNENIFFSNACTVFRILLTIFIITFIVKSKILKLILFRSSLILTIC